MITQIHSRLKLSFWNIAILILSESRLIWKLLKNIFQFIKQQNVFKLILAALAAALAGLTGGFGFSSLLIILGR